MKIKLLLLALLTSSFAFSQAKTDALTRVKAGVRKHLYLTMKDYKSYQPVQWSKLVLDKTEYSDTEEGRALMDEVDAEVEQSEIIVEQIKELAAVLGDKAKGDSTITAKLDSAKYHADKAELVLKKYKQLNKAYPHVVVFYKILHSFRGKNSYGAYTISTYRFTLNKKFEVISAVDPDEDDEE